VNQVPGINYSFQTWTNYSSNINGSGWNFVNGTLIIMANLTTAGQAYTITIQGPSYLEMAAFILLPTFRSSPWIILSSPLCPGRRQPANHLDRRRAFNLSITAYQDFTNIATTLMVKQFDCAIRL